MYQSRVIAISLCLLISSLQVLASLHAVNLDAHADSPDCEICDLLHGDGAALLADGRPAPTEYYSSVICALTGQAVPCATAGWIRARAPPHSLLT